LKQWISNHCHHNNNTEYDGEKTLSSDSHITAASTSSSANDEKTNTIINNKFSHEKLKNDYNLRNDSSKMNMLIVNNRMLPFKCHFCKLVFGNNFKRMKGYSPQSIIKTLDTTQTVIYNDESEMLKTSCGKNNPSLT
jgi:hypothetical protein